VSDCDSQVYFIKEHEDQICDINTAWLRPTYLFGKETNVYSSIIRETFYCTKCISVELLGLSNCVYSDDASS
jgi:hypothetical protein